MNDRAIEVHYPAYRAPSVNESALITPSLTSVMAELRGAGDAPRDDAHTGVAQPMFCGLALSAARAQARCETVRLAIKFTSRYRDVGDLGFCRRPCDEIYDEVPSISEPATSYQAGRATKPIVLTGHQPELFHPGVWFKNFLASRLAAEAGGIAINFLVDNDVCRSASIRVPSRLGTGVVAQSVPFDNQRDAVPWEFRQLSSRAVWDAFPQRIAAEMLPIAGEPLVHELWHLATEGLVETNRLGLAISQGRHQLERSLGLKSLEVPLSWLSDSESFGRFSLSLLGDLERFQSVYNSQLERYRSAHQIRNHAHPVPPLEQEHEWLEAPLWVYRSSAPHRQRLWVSRRRGQLFLTDRTGWQTCIETTDGELGNPETALQQWMELKADGVCLRPRALLTTMYTRLFIADMFVHGIGGGKYDQLTDAIVAEYFHLAPPPMLVASATLRLPLENEAQQLGSSEQTEQKIREYRDQLWRARHHADQVLDGEPRNDGTSHEIADLQRRKAALLAEIPPRGEKWEWHHQITAVNKRLSELAESKIREAKSAVDELTTLERQQRLLESREFSFALFPRDYVATVLQRLAEA